MKLVYPFNGKEVRNFHTLSYIGKPSVKLKYVFYNAGYNMTFETNNNLAKNIKNNKLTKFNNLVYLY